MYKKSPEIELNELNKFDSDDMQMSNRSNNTAALTSHASDFTQINRNVSVIGLLFTGIIGGKRHC